MPLYVTLDQAKTHLREPDAAANGDVYLKATQASGIIADYLDSQADPAWTADTAPGPVQTATLLMLTHLYQNRGDDMTADDMLWSAIRRLLARLRDPTVA